MTAFLPARLRTSLLAGAVLVLCVSVGPPAAADTHTISHPTAGVTCDEWRHILPNGDASYEGKCTGDPVGFNRGYRYREGQECDYAGSPAWVYGAWRVQNWSTPPTCPGGSGIIAHQLTFQWQ
jgi:hypothetical protein